MAMQTVALIRIDREDWANQLKDAIETAAQRNTGDSQVVQFTDNQTGADLVLCLGSSALTCDSVAQSEIAAALQRGIRIVPIVSELARFKSEVPIELYPINGIAWG